ncbi:MAG: N-acetylmuramic acid 6-phosphate etherase [Caldisericaceae bacterium]|nr:N-acetylmuramic acid 6-phosphate etherase [Caldisericaceae bacterium]
MKKEIINNFDTEKLVYLMFQSSKRAFEAVESALHRISVLTDKVTETVKNGGRIFYVGAGTSGRIGVLDASEIYPTFGEENLFNALIAGGKEAMFKAKEYAEDSSAQGEEDLKNAGFAKSDIAIGISASGKTPYVLGALKFARSIGARTSLISCRAVNYDFVDYLVVADTGEEFIKGSTRLNAGTAEKLILNMVSTISMIKAGRTYDNLMVAVVPSNNKLVDRAARIVSELTGAPFDKARELVMKTKDARIASLMLKKDLTEEEARNLLKKEGFDFPKAYEG